MKSVILTALLFPLLAFSQVAPDRYLKISIPQHSGWFATNYKRYEVKGDSLFIWDQPVHLEKVYDSTLGDSLLAKYPINSSFLHQLDSLLEHTDTLVTCRGMTPGRGAIRYFIETRYKGRKMQALNDGCETSTANAFSKWLIAFKRKSNIQE